MKEYWAEAAKLIRQALRRTPDDHWLLTRLASTYYERRRYRRALHYSKRAMALAPRCPLVLWDYSSSLRMVGRHRDAIRLLRKLMARGESSLATGECGEGLVRARALINDSRYKIARSYADMGSRGLARRFLRAYLRERERGKKGIYSKHEAMLLLRSLEERVGPREESRARCASS